MKKLFILICFFPMFGTSQSNILNATSPEEIGISSVFDEFDSDENPLAYGYISDKDVLFSKTIWEEINLDERVNFPMYYPVDTMSVGNERRPLLHYLYTSVLSGQIENIYEKDNLKKKKSIDKLKRQLIYRKIREGSDNNRIGESRISTYGGRIQFIKSNNISVPDSLIQWQVNYDNGLYNDLPIVIQDSLYNDWEETLDNIIFDNNLLSDEEFSIEKFEYQDVTSYKLKGVWYFDKKIAELRYRPIAICPIVKIPAQKSTNPNDPKTFEMFWIFYPDVRKTMHKALAFNDKNTSKPISFDHLINSRRFSAYIYKEDNVYEDREINDYISENALMQLLESQRIKEKIRNLEQDMWSY